MRRRSGLAGRDLERLLHEAPVPVDRGAEERGLEMVLAAQAERRPRRRSPLPRLAVSFAVAVLVAGLLLTPAWAAVRDWVGGVFESAPAMRAPQGGLRSIPGGGRLLVQTAAGPWVVQPDGSRKLLGDFEEASWSPHGLFVAAVRGDELAAVTPAGAPHWRLRAAAPIHDPRWAPSGELVAYRAGAGLRVVAGDGSEDRPIDESVAPLAPAWAPGAAPLLAYVDARGALRVVDAASGRAVARASALPGIGRLEWGLDAGGSSGRGGLLLEASRRQIHLRTVAAGSATESPPALSGGSAAHLGLRHPRPLHLPRGAVVRAAALAPDGRTVAALLARRGRGPRRGEVTDLVLYSTASGAPRRLGSVPGRLTELAWSPNGKRLLVAWPSFDEWLFVPPGAAEGQALTGIAKAFTPAGAPRSFPAVVGWCCRAHAP
jgi:hypothetical protein